MDYDRKLKSLMPLMFFAFFLSVILGCTAMKTERKIIKKTESPTIHQRVSIKPSRIYEECVELLPSHSMEYSFKSSKPLTFNIHYHTEDEIVYPVLKKSVSEWRGTLNVEDQHYYDSDQEFFCLMWENTHSVSVSVEFEYTIRE